MQSPSPRVQVRQSGVAECSVILTAHCVFCHILAYYTQGHAAASLVNFAESADDEVLEPYVLRLLERLFGLVRDGLPFVQVSVLRLFALLSSFVFCEGLTRPLQSMCLCVCVRAQYHAMNAIGVLADMCPLQFSPYVGSCRIAPANHV